MIHIYDNDKQMIAVVHDFVSQEECEEILAYSWQNMERSTVASKDGKVKNIVKEQVRIHGYSMMHHP